MVLQATQAADQAKAAVQQNSLALQKKLAERQKLLSQLDQAKMQEQLNTAMATLSESVGQDVPTFDEVRDKIEARYAKAKGMAELQGQTVENRMLEIEQATANTEAKGRLDEMRVELGLASAPQPAAVEPPPSPAAPDAQTCAPVDGAARRRLAARHRCPAQRVGAERRRINAAGRRGRRGGWLRGGRRAAARRCAGRRRRAA